MAKQLYLVTSSSSGMVNFGAKLKSTKYGEGVFEEINAGTFILHTEDTPEQIVDLLMSDQQLKQMTRYLGVFSVNYPFAVVDQLGHHNEALLYRQALEDLHSKLSHGANPAVAL